MTLTEAFRLHAANTDKETVHSYGAMYDRWLGPLTDQPIKLLAIGVSLFGGGDLLAFAEALPKASLFALDIDVTQIGPDLMRNPRMTFVVGDAYVPPVLSILPEHFDIIIDDCLHEWSRQADLFARWWSRVAAKGQYIIEDVGASTLEILAARVREIADRNGIVEMHDLSAERAGSTDNCLIRVVHA